MGDAANLVPSRRSPRLSARFIALLGFIFVSIMRSIYPERTMEYTGIRALLDWVFLISLALFLGLVSLIVGQRLVSRLKHRSMRSVESIVFHFALGLAIIAYLLLVIGLLGFFQPASFLVLLLLLGIYTFSGWDEAISEISSVFRQVYRSWRALSAEFKIYTSIIGVILGIILIQACAPPVGYDALMYHLQAPRVFLEAGRIISLPDNWPANGPLTPQMLFSIGVALKSDSFGRLLHAFALFLLSLSILSFARRFFNVELGFLSLAIFLGIPILPFWASLAYSDLFWTLFEFLALYCLIAWYRTDHRGWLVQGAIFTGLAIGTKYMAIAQYGILMLLLLWMGVMNKGRVTVKDVVLFALITVVIGSPWYIRNWLEFKNPIFPFVFDSSGGIAQALLEYHRSFSTGHSLGDYLLLPINLYLAYPKFGTFGGSIEIPSPLFLIVLVYPWIRHQQNTQLLAGVALLRFIGWAASSQQTRHLLPLFPVLAILSAYVLMELSAINRLKRAILVLRQGIVAGLLAVTMVYGLLNLAATRPFGVIVGLESKSDFLYRNVHDFGAVTYILNELPQDARVLFLWDAQGFYCDARCFPDSEHRQWTRIVEPDFDLLSTSIRLHELSITHLLLSVPDAAFILAHDPDGQQAKALEFLTSVYQPACTHPVYHDQNVEILAVDC